MPNSLTPSSTVDALNRFKEQLAELANRDHSELLYEKRYAEWYRNCLASARARAAYNLMDEVIPISIEDTERLLNS